MTFTFTNYAGIEPQKSPFNNLIGQLLSGYTGVKNAQYLPREKEADIFHKQIAPLAMLASSPYFSSLHETQQKQIADYISQMLSRQGIGGNIMDRGATGVMPNSSGTQGPQGNQPVSSGIPTLGNESSLAPINPAEHFTKQYTTNPIPAGTAFRGEKGETIYTPTGSNVQKGIDVLTETKGLKNLFDKYSELAPKVGGAGGIKREVGRLSSGIERTGLPLSKQISQFLGGGELPNKAAKAESYKAQMAPALRSIGFSNQEIDDLLRYYPGENEQNIKERLKNTWPVIERKIKSHQQNLKRGINVNNQPVIGENEVPRSIDEKIARDQKERSNAEKSRAVNKQYKEAPPGTIGLYKEGRLFYIPPDKVDKALSEGFTYE